MSSRRRPPSPARRVRGELARSIAGSPEPRSPFVSTSRWTSRPAAPTSRACRRRRSRRRRDARRPPSTGPVLGSSAAPSGHAVAASARAVEHVATSVRTGTPVAPAARGRCRRSRERRAGDVQVHPRRVADELRQEQRRRDGAAPAVADVLHVGDAATRSAAGSPRHSGSSHRLADGLAGREHVARSARRRCPSRRVMSVAERHHARAGERRRVDDHLRLLLREVRERVGQHQAALGVGVQHLRRLAAAMREDVAGLRSPSRSACSRCDGIAAITLTFGFSSAIARIVREDRRGAAHVVLHRLHALGVLDRQAAGVERDALAGDRDRRGRGPPPVYVSSIMRGGFTLPAPTPRMPPNPPFSSSASLQTLHVSPTSRAIFCASRAICAGGMSPAGVFTRSRAQFTASATMRRAPRAARAGLGVAAPEHGHLRERLRQVLRRRAVPVEAVGAEAESLGRRLHGLEGALAGDGLRERRRDRRRTARRSGRRARGPPAGRFASNSFLSPTPTSRTAPAANPSPAGTRSCSSRLPVSFAAAKAFWRPVSFTPGPGSGPAKTGRINRSARTEAAEPVVNERSATAMFLSRRPKPARFARTGQSIGSSTSPRPPLRRAARTAGGGYAGPRWRPGTSATSCTSTRRARATRPCSRPSSCSAA